MTQICEEGSENGTYADHILGCIYKGTTHRQRALKLVPLHKYLCRPHSDSKKKTVEMRRTERKRWSCNSNTPLWFVRSLSICHQNRERERERDRERDRERARARARESVWDSIHIETLNLKGCGIARELTRAFICLLIFFFFSSKPEPSRAGIARSLVLIYMYIYIYIYICIYKP